GALARGHARWLTSRARLVRGAGGSAANPQNTMPRRSGASERLLVPDRSGEPDGLAAQVLAERLEHLGDDAFGVEAGLAIHGGRRVLVDEQVGQHHRADLDAAIEHV